MDDIFYLSYVPIKIILYIMINSHLFIFITSIFYFQYLLIPVIILFTLSYRYYYLFIYNSIK